MEIILTLSTSFHLGHIFYKSLSNMNSEHKSKLFSFEIDCEMIDDKILNDLVFEKDQTDEIQETLHETMEYEIEYDKLIFDEHTEEDRPSQSKDERKSSLNSDFDVLANVDVKEFNNLISNYSEKELEIAETNYNTKMTLFSIMENIETPKKTKLSNPIKNFSDFFKKFKKKRWSNSKDRNLLNTVYNSNLNSNVSSPGKNSETSQDSTDTDNYIPSFLKKKRKILRDNNKYFTLEKNKGETFISINTKNKDEENFTKDNAEFLSDNYGSSKISIVSYNILNQIYMKKTGREDLSLENRMKIIIRELKNLCADIICLQEADISVLKTYITNNLSEYNFVYGVNCGSSFINVVGYNKEKFRLISFKNFSLLNFKIVGNRGAMNVVLERNTANKENVSIYNIHFPWRHEKQRCEILEMLFNNVNENNLDLVLIAGDFNSEPSSLPVKLIYYDQFWKEYFGPQMDNLNPETEIGEIYKNLNSVLPWKEEKFNLFENVCFKYRFRSAYENYKKYLRSCTKEDGDQWRINLSSGKKKYRIKCRKGKKINDNLNMKHHITNTNNYSYKNVANHIGRAEAETRNKLTSNFKRHPDLTTCTAFYKNTIDYIFYSKKFRITKILKLPEMNEILEEEFLPSVKYPSDHLKIYAEFQIPTRGLLNG